MNGIHIAQVTHPKCPWEVRIPKNLRLPGEIRRRYFATKEAAEDFIRHRGAPPPTAATNPEEAAALAILRASIAPGQSLVTLASRVSALQVSMTFSEACERVLARRKVSAMDRSYLDYERRLGRIRADFGPRQAASIQTHEIDAWLRDLECTGYHAKRGAVSDQTRKHYRTLLWSVFHTAKVIPNPMEDSVYRNLSIRRPAPAIFQPDEWAEVLKSGKGEASLPCLLVGGFAHVRVEESLRMRWDRHISWDSREILLDEEITKIPSAKRNIHICDTLWNWLQPYRKIKTGRIADSINDIYGFQTLKRRIERNIRNDKALDLKKFKWPANGLRHSSASYYLRKYEDRNRLREELGHTNPDTLIRHYLNSNIRKAAAEAYYAIQPV